MNTTPALYTRGALCHRANSLLRPNVGVKGYAAVQKERVRRRAGLERYAALEIGGTPQCRGERVCNKLREGCKQGWEGTPQCKRGGYAPVLNVRSTSAGGVPQCTAVMHWRRLLSPVVSLYLVSVLVRKKETSKNYIRIL